MNKEDEWLEINKKHHDHVAATYKSNHAEIYNTVEQGRLASQLKRIIEQLQVNVPKPIVMDFGTGAGNLTEYLLNLGCMVTAVDVSEKCLEEVKKRFSTYGSSLNTKLINGRDLSEFPSNHFDFCGTYSVLHHVPDYLSAVAELARVTKPGGIIMIDHEGSSQMWSPPSAGLEYLKLYREAKTLSKSDRYSPSSLVKRCLIKFKKIRNPRYHEEGDIHIWKDDHIEWDLVVKQLENSGCHAIEKLDYLLCRERGKETPLYDAFKDKYRDMSVIIAVKG